MTSYIPYVPNASAFENLDMVNVKRKKFYTGRSKNAPIAQIKLVSPTKQDVERAKLDLKREGAINIASTTTKRKSSSSKTDGHKSKSKKTAKNIKSATSKQRKYRKK